jgi:NDP-sugar pyrophosphorylase family protein
MEIYSSHLESQLDAGVADRLTYAKDDKQHGTAHAVQMHCDQHAISVTVMNGDTIFSDYTDLIPGAVGADEIVLSTSFQTVGRAGAVQQNIKTGKIDFKKDRDGGISQTNWVTNGVVTFGGSALKLFYSETVTKGLSLENAVLSLQTRPELEFTLYRAKARFLDIGVPDDFKNAETKYNELVASDL